MSATTVMRRACPRDVVVRSETPAGWGGLTSEQRQHRRDALPAKLGRDEPLAGSAVLQQALTTVGVTVRARRR